jgi:hypothetical protein
MIFIDTTEPNKSKSKFRQELERTWDLERRLEHGQKTIKLLNQMENKIQNQQSRPTNLALTGLSRPTLAVLNEDYPKVKILNQSKK